MQDSMRTIASAASAMLIVAGCSGETPNGNTSSSSSSGSGGESSSSSSGQGGAGGQAGSGGAGGQGGTQCATPCGSDATCNAQGQCVCDPGFTGDGQLCLDIDECSEQTDNCHATAACTNSPGSFSCACPSGTIGDPFTGCEERWLEVTASLYHTCARRIDNAVFCFGSGGSGRLGNGLSTNQSKPVQAGASNNWQHISAGGAHTCGIKTTGNLWCWGSNGFGQLGIGNTTSQTLPMYVSLERQFTNVATGDNHSCAIENDGTLSCFGRNAAGQIGNGTTDTKLDPIKISVDSAAMTPDADWNEVFAGRDTTCATKKDGKLYCWGQNSSLQVSKTGGSTVLTPFLVETMAGAADADWATAAVGFTTCGIKKDGRMFCWGRGNEGQLGTGPLAASSATPLEVGAGKMWKKVRINGFHICALDTQDALSCWGRNNSGQMGTTTPGWILAPTDVFPGMTFKDFATGSVHTSAVTKEDKIVSLGSRVFGQLGDGMMSLQMTPYTLGADTTWKTVVSYGESGCAINQAGELHCFGNNESGQFGLGDDITRLAPTKSPLPTTIQQASMGRQHTCVLTNAGKIMCSGRNASGQLGLTNTIAQKSFVDLVTAGKPYDGLSWKTIASGEEHNCAISTTGRLFCWGRNAEGQSGLTNPATGSLIEIVLVTGQPAPTDWLNVAAGQFHTCGVRMDGSLYCWGRNAEGQLGNGMPASGKIAPLLVGTGFKGPLALGVNHTCALKQNGSLQCWGRNANGQLGDNTTVDKPSPISVDAATDWAEVTAGNATTCGRKVDGTTYCWGVNTFGHLGVGDLGQRRVPVLVAGTHSSISMGFGHTCAASMTGSLLCWGSGEFGQNGRGDAFPQNPSPLAASY
jgi:alpha-tubulin suppressor-like RCC1 family protein